MINKAKNAIQPKDDEKGWQFWQGMVTIMRVKTAKECDHWRQQKTKLQLYCLCNCLGCCLDQQWKFLLLTRSDEKRATIMTTTTTTITGFRDDD